MMLETHATWSSPRLTVALLLCIGIALLAPTIWDRAGRPAHAEEAQPSADNALNTDGGVPGDPQKSLSILRKLYPVILQYRQRHGGSLPATAAELVNDILANREVYGCVPADFATPHVRFTRSGENMQQHFFPWMISNRRPDGSIVGSPDPKGGRELYAWSDIHFNRNFRNGANGSTERPVGYVTVLWADGVAQLLPYTDLMLVPSGPGEWTAAVRGQAGLPSNAKQWFNAPSSSSRRIGGPVEIPGPHRQLSRRPSLTAG